MNSPNELLAALMDDAGCSRSALARDIRELARVRGLKGIRCDHVDVGRWLNGMVPRGEKPALIAEALGRRLGRALSLSELGPVRPAIRSKAERGYDLALGAAPSARRASQPLSRADVYEASRAAEQRVPRKDQIAPPVNKLRSDSKVTKIHMRAVLATHLGENTDAVRNIEGWRNRVAIERRPVGEPERARIEIHVGVPAEQLRSRDVLSMQRQHC